MEMRGFNSVIIFSILLCSCSFLVNDATARISFGYGVESLPLEVNQQWVHHIQRSCRKELAEIEKELGACDLYLLWKPDRADIESTAVRRKRGSHETFVKLPSHLDKVLLSCLHNNYHHHVHTSSTQDGRIKHVLLPFHQSNIARRYLAEKPSKERTSSAPGPLSDVFDKPIYIPPELLFKAPPPPSPAATKSKTVSPAKGDHSKDLNIIIVIVASASLTVLAIILGLVLFCLLRGGGFGSRDKQRDDKPLLTTNSYDFCAGSPRNPHNNINNFGGNTSSSNGPFQNPGDGLHGTAVAGGGVGGVGNPEPGQVASGNAEASTSQQSDNAPPPPPAAAPPPPPPKPKAPPPPGPPPPHKGVRPPPPPAAGKGPGRSRGRSSSGDGSDMSGDNGQRTKLKPFFWDKVVGNPEHSMVWDEIRAGSFQFNEEMIESLFGYNPEEKRQGAGKSRLSDASQTQYIQIIDPKKSQNLSILLKALNVTTEEVSDALIEGNELPVELLQTLLRMAPTQEEELKLRLFSGNLAQLGPAERFLKVLVDIPFVFKRMESLMFMMNYKEEVSNIKDSFITLEVACEELKKSRLFLKILEAVLKTGNRMNDGTYRGGAQAFKLDTLLKLADVKGTDGKTTLLHFVVQEIVRTEGMKAARAKKDNCSISSMKSDDFVEDTSFDPVDHHRALGLEVVSNISRELENVKKAAIIDADVLTSTVAKLGQSLVKIKNFLSNEVESSGEENGFYEALASFAKESENEVTWLLEEERRISEMVRKTADYFHGSPGREEGLRLFIIVRDFLILLDRICSEIRQSLFKQKRDTGKETSNKAPPQEQQQNVHEDMRRRLFPAIADRRVEDDSSSDSSDDDSV